MDDMLDLPGDTKIFCAVESTKANLAFCLKVEPGNEKIMENAKVFAEEYKNDAPCVPSTLIEEKSYNVFMRSREEIL